MIRQQNKQSLTTKDEVVEEMVIKRYKKMRELGQFETVEQIFGKLPISRIEKQYYQFLFDSIKQNVEATINRQNLLQRILEKQEEAIANIDVKGFRDGKHRLSQKDPLKNQKLEGNGKIVVLSQFSFDYQVEDCYNQKLTSEKPIFKSIYFLRNQNHQYFGERFGFEKPFIQDRQYLSLKQVNADIGNVKLLLQNQKDMQKYNLQFHDENLIEFKSRCFPSKIEIEKRAEVLAKLYLLHLYKEEGASYKQIYKNKEIQLNKQREIKKIKQQLEVQKKKQGEMIEEMDLIKQVYKILLLIEKKMNEEAYKEFSSKNGNKATQIKRSLQKLKQQINAEPSAKVKLRNLIAYKFKKGW